jgi:hypothetical protein
MGGPDSNPTQHFQGSCHLGMGDEIDEKGQSDPRAVSVRVTLRRTMLNPSVFN